MTTAARPVPAAEPAAVAAYRRALPPGELIAFPLTPLDRTGVPVWTATHLGADGATHGVGYGATDGEAMTGAMGELAEGAALATGLPRLPRRRGPYADLVAELGPAGVLDPRTACLPAGSDWTPGRPLTWITATRVATGEPVLVPEELVASHPAELPDRDGLLLPITNGLGAGDTPERALAHGLLELVQRDGNSVAYRAMDRGLAIDLDGVTDEGLGALLARVAAAGIRVVPKLADDDLGIPSVYVVGDDADPSAAGHPLMATACGEAAHPHRETALRKALLEYLSSRVRKAFMHGPAELVARVAPPGYLGVPASSRPLPGEEEETAAMRGWLGRDYAALRDLVADPVLAVRGRVPLDALPGGGPAPEGPAEVLAAVLDRLGAAGLDVLAVVLTPPGAEVTVTRAIVPGLEVETMSYGRIGARNLRRLTGRGSALVGRGTAPEGGRRIVLPPPLEAELGPAWLDWHEVRRTVGGLFPLYREPARHVAAGLGLEAGGGAT